MSIGSKVIFEGLVWPESPRWRNGQLWISEAFAQDSGVRVLTPSGKEMEHYRVSGGPAGLDFLSDGSVVLALAFDRKLAILRPNDQHFKDYMDLTSVARYPNELIVGTNDLIIVSDSAFRVGQDEFETGRVIFVLSDGTAKVASEDLAFPNGLALAPDGSSLRVAETFASRLSQFDLEDNGRLVNRRVFVAFDTLGTVKNLAKMFERQIAPDGICCDRDGNTWVANPLRAEVHCFSDAGEIIDTVAISQGGIACILGGSDGRTLFATTGNATDMTGSNGRIEVARVAVPAW